MDQMVRAYDRDGIRFAIWVGHGRDPEVAYLDDTQLVIASAELRTDGWHLFDEGAASNILGGVVEGPIDPAVLHRISHGTGDGEGSPAFRIDQPDGACGQAHELCEVALGPPHLGTPYREPGSFHLDADFALQWVAWEDAQRAGILRRAVYVDDRYLLEAGLGADGTVRIWPARGLLPFGIELITPTGREAVRIEERVSEVTRAR
jgi:hypothetical protein